MITIKDLKQEFRMLNDDPHSALNALFDLCEWLWVTNIADIPPHWKFKPGEGISSKSPDDLLANDNEYYWVHLYQEVEPDELLRWGEILHRYHHYLEFKWLRY